MGPAPTKTMMINHEGARSLAVLLLAYPSAPWCWVLEHKCQEKLLKTVMGRASMTKGVWGDRERRETSVHVVAVAPNQRWISPITRQTPMMS